MITDGIRRLVACWLWFVYIERKMDDNNRSKIRFRGRGKDQPVEEDASSTVKLAHRGVVSEAETELLGRCRFPSWNPTQTLRIS